jgi:hypothetical protein
MLSYWVKIINIIKKNSEALLDTGKKVGLEVNTKKTEYIFMSRYQTTGQNHYIKVVNKSLENVAKFKCLEITVTNQNCIYEESNNRLNLRNACYHIGQIFFSSCLLSKNIKIKIYKSLILPVALYGCETWSFMLREEYIEGVWEQGTRRIFGPKRAEVTGG